MDIFDAHGRVAMRRALLPLSLLLAASTVTCSSSSSSPSTSPDSGPVAAHDSGGLPSGGNPILPNADPAVCVSEGAGGCPGCCGAVYPGGSQFNSLAVQHCRCIGPGSCADVCGDAECASGYGATIPCQQCLDGLASRCAQEAATACAGDSTCKQYMACQTTCPH